MKTLGEMFSKVNLKSSGRLFGFGMSPETDWKIIFITTVVLLLLVTALNVFMFLKIDKGEIFVIEGSGDGVKQTLDVAKLRETVSYYENKAIEFERILNATSTSTAIVDPSF